VASHRDPKGLYNRDTWDWYQLADAVVSYIDGTPLSGGNTGTYTLWSLTNNDSLGRSFYVKMIVGSFDTGIMTILSFANQQVLTPVANAAAINPSWGAQSGVLGYQRFDHVVSFPDPLNPNIGAPYCVLPNGGFVGNSWQPQPSVIVPANTSLMIGNDASIAPPLALTIFYTIMPSGF
jgi:hypothetical protein